MKAKKEMSKNPKSPNPQSSVVTNSAPFNPQSSPVVTNSAPFIPQSTRDVINSASFNPQSSPVVTNSAPFNPQSSPVVTNSAPFNPQSSTVVTNSALIPKEQEAFDATHWKLFFEEEKIAKQNIPGCEKFQKYKILCHGEKRWAFQEEWNPT